MASSSSSDQNPSSRTQQWRFTWEALAHISTLRLYLFPVPSSSSLSISNVTAALQFDLSLLVVSFVDGNEDEIFLRIPVPKVLIDPESEIECVVKSDYVEIKLNLVLPVDHPVVTDFQAASGLNVDDNLIPLSLDDDLKGLSSGDIDLYCKSCSAKLTKEPLRKITEMPSMIWREVADNWFGNCCCTFGATSEILVNNYLNSFSLSQISLLHSSSITVNKDSIFLSSSDDLPLIFNPQISTHNNITTQLNNSDHCCHEEKTVHDEIIIDEKNSNTYMGGGFILSENNISKDINWVEFYCYKCSSIIGSYPCKNSGKMEMIDGGIRLFKCYISTSLPIGSSNDIFRKYTVQNLFLNLLMETAKDEISFRTLVRDLKSKKPILQIVLLSSSKAWCFSGSCFENRVDGSGCRAGLKPVMKVLFSDCTDADARLVENWSSKYEAEEIYMHMVQIEELNDCLDSNLQNIPLSCSSLQGMNLSWLSPN